MTWKNEKVINKNLAGCRVKWWNEMTGHIVLINPKRFWKLMVAVIVILLMVV